MCVAWGGVGPCTVRSNVSLPSATKLRRLCFYTCLSGHRGVPGPGEGCLVPGGWGPALGDPGLGGGAWSQGCLVQGGWYPSTDADPPHPADGYCCGRYASYWNAFLWLMFSWDPSPHPTHIHTPVKTLPFHDFVRGR